MKLPEIEQRIPQFVKSNRDLNDFWPFIKAKFETYAERREFISTELNSLISYYEDIKLNEEIIRVNSDSYEVGEEIGQGGYGRVHKYFHKQLEVDFAIKFLAPSFITDPTEILYYRDRFFREAKMLFTFSHENIVRFYDVGTTKETPFIKMELVTGFNIHELLAKYSVLKFDKSLVPIRHILKGLSCAHSAGVVHRDIKPSNILFDTKSKLFKIIDFGIGAYIEYELHTKLTKTGESVVGSTYTAPELIENPKLIDIRSDIYSLGAVWFYLLTGLTPKGSGLEKMLIASNIAQNQINIILKCLSPIDDRYSSCDDVLFAIDELTKGEKTEGVSFKEAVELTSQEVALLGSILHNQYTPADSVSVLLVKEHMRKVGFNEISVNLATRKLVAKGFVSFTEDSDMNGCVSYLYWITEVGDKWILSNEDKFDMIDMTISTESEVFESDMPF